MSEASDTWSDTLEEVSLKAVYRFVGKVDDVREAILAVGNQTHDQLKASHADHRVKQDFVEKADPNRRTVNSMTLTLTLRQSWRRGCAVSIWWSARQPGVIAIGAHAANKLDKLIEVLCLWTPLAGTIIGLMVLISVIDTHVVNMGCWDWPAYVASVLVGFVVGAFVSSWVYAHVGLRVLSRLVPRGVRDQNTALAEKAFEQARATADVLLPAAGAQPDAPDVDDSE